AEDGIRDFHVTGVQTCALPIYQHEDQQDDLLVAVDPDEECWKPPPEKGRQEAVTVQRRDWKDIEDGQDDIEDKGHLKHAPGRREIGRASCRERRENTVVVVA